LPLVGWSGPHSARLHLSVIGVSILALHCTQSNLLTDQLARDMMKRNPLAIAERFPNAVVCRR